MNDINTNSNVTATSTKITAKVGRPAMSLKLILNKTFSLKDLQALNPDVKPVTIRAAVLRGLENGRFTKLNRTVRSGRKGKPASLFINTKVYEANLRNLAKSKVTVNVAETDAVTA